MKAKKILFATDFSEYSETAKKLATSLARDSGAMILIVHVVEPPPHFADRGFAGYAEEGESGTEARQQLNETKPDDASIGYSHKLLSGAPAKEIVGYAGSEDVDLIVIGSHGRTGVMRMLMGSVAEEIVRKAPCPVLTVKHADVAATAEA